MQKRLTVSQNAVGKRGVLFVAISTHTHHGMLGSDRVNRNGYSLEKVLEETELSVVNDATPTKFSVTGKGSVWICFL